MSEGMKVCDVGVRMREWRCGYEKSGGIRVLIDLVGVGDKIREWVYKMNIKMSM